MIDMREERKERELKENDLYEMARWRKEADEHKLVWDREGYIGETRSYGHRMAGEACTGRMWRERGGGLSEMEG
jgi:hypothetical protein